MHMRGLLTVLIIMFFHLSMAAQTQSGVVKTRGRMIDGNYVPGKGLPGALENIPLQEWVITKTDHYHCHYTCPCCGHEWHEHDEDTVEHRDYTPL